MASNSTLETFDPAVESVDDYKERFDFYCTAVGVRQDRLKAFFLARVGREVFSKVKILASPRPLTELDLPEIVDLMKEHYNTERFKFFKRAQQEQETLANYLAELRKLAKNCNFGNYLDTALRDQLVCGLSDRKTQWELLCIPNLTLAIASERARAAEAASRETQQLNPAVATHQLSQHGSHCHRCGRHGHTGATCIHKDKRCHYCKKVGHLSSVCGKKKSETTKTTPSRKDKKSSKQRKTHLVDVQVDSDSFSDEAFDTSHNHVHHSGCHGRMKKLTTKLLLNGTEI